MGTKNDPGQYDCWSGAEPDEPMFILLGRDPMAGILVRVWVKLREEVGEDPAKLENALHTAAALERWAISKGKKAKVEAAIESLARMSSPAR